MQKILNKMTGASSGSGEGSHQDFDVEKVLASLTLNEKISLLGGRDFWHTVGIEKKGIPPVRMSDGPNGVRGTQFFNGTPSNCFPCATGLASSFDVELAHEIGVQLGKECAVKGAHILLGPTMNIQRSPLGGRGFESFSEDPVLSGNMASEYIKGVQSKGVAATPKHFVGNDQEFERLSSDSVIPERALREIYLEPFRIAQKNADPWCYMTAYNRVNGTHVSESKAILEDILRKEWGFEGMVMSDWTGVYSCVESIKAGLDLEMPGPPVFRGAQALRSIHAGKLHEFELDERIRKVLGVVKRAIESGIPFNAKEEADNSAEVRALLRKAAADSIVLLKNDKQLLPLTNKTKKIAVIGSNARTAVISGGGSASMLASYAISPLEGIQEAAKEIGAEVEYSIGAAEYDNLPPVHPMCTYPGGAKADAVAKIEFWLENPGTDFETSPSFKGSKPHYTLDTKSANCLMMDGLPTEVSTGSPFIRYTTTFVPDSDGPWEFALASAGSSNLFFDGKLIIDNSTKWQPGELWFNTGSLERRQVVPSLQKGKEYSLEVRSWHREDLRGSPFKTAGAIRIGALPSFTPEQGIADAVRIAAEADTAIVVVGLNEDFESEGFDRKHMQLPGAADKLVAAILAVNPNTIVVNQTGTPVTMPWVDKASTIVQAFYGGNAVGLGLADVLFGKVNPSGKLSLTFPKRLADSPSDIGYGIQSENTGKTIYTESIYVGYRYFDKAQLAPLFAFGHGKSYSTFAYSDIAVSSISDEGAFEVKCSVENTGKVAGREVVQVYIKDKESKLARAPKELKGFRKVNLKPGQKETVTIKLDRDALKYWDDLRQQWTAEAGEFEVLVGGASDDTSLSATTKLEKTLTWTGL